LHCSVLNLALESRVYKMARRGPPPDTSKMISLKVDGFSTRSHIDDIEDLFSKYGKVGDVYIPKDYRTKENRGFGFVRYYSKHDAEDAIDGLDGRKFDGRELSVQYAKYDRPDRDYRGGGGGRGGRSRSRSRGRRDRSRSRSKGGRRDRSRSRSNRSKSRSKSRDRKASRSKSRDRKASRSKSPDRRRRGSGRSDRSDD